MSARCSICRVYRPTTESLIEHLVEHKPQLLAEDLVKAQALAAEYQSRAAMAERCGKVGYKSEEAATNALLSIWRTFGNDSIRREVRVYQCHRCNGRWHLTSQPAEARGATA